MNSFRLLQKVGVQPVGRKAHRLTFCARKLMQTFVPYPDIEQSVQCLDWRRLGKQRVEAFQIINGLAGLKMGWRNHPAFKMWIGYRPFLILYMNSCIREWIRRGYVNNMKPMQSEQATPPPWWGGPIHTTHRSVLLFKHPVWYAQFGWTEEPGYNYFWPSKEITDVSSSTNT